MQQRSSSHPAPRKEAMSSACSSLSPLLRLRPFPPSARNPPQKAAVRSSASPRSMRHRALSGGRRPREDHLCRSMAQSASAEEEAAPKSVPVAVAYELLKSGHRYLDVRTVEEFSDGHAVGAVNIPYMFRSNSGMSKNPRFVEEVLSNFERDEEIIVGCLLGKRSLMAASELSKAGFTAITDVSGGYSAWVQSGLPTET